MKIEQIQKAEDLLAWVKSKGYVTFEKLPWDLNIIGVRRAVGKQNSFDDRIYVVYKDDTDLLHLSSWAATTDPGTYWLNNSMNKLGTAMLVPGQYRGCWELGMHHDNPGLVQIKPVKTYRDANHDSKFDIDQAKITEGLYGINLHRAGAHSTNVDKWSAGCQVWANNDDYEDFLRLCKNQIKYRGYKTFTYTLLVEE